MIAGYKVFGQVYISNDFHLALVGTVACTSVLETTAASICCARLRLSCLFPLLLATPPPHTQHTHASRPVQRHWPHRLSVVARKRLLPGGHCYLRCVRIGGVGFAAPGSVEHCTVVPATLVYLPTDRCTPCFSLQSDFRPAANGIAACLQSLPSHCRRLSADLRRADCLDILPLWRLAVALPR